MQYNVGDYYYDVIQSYCKVYWIGYVNGDVFEMSCLIGINFIVFGQLLIAEHFEWIWKKHHGSISKKNIVALSY